MDPSAQYNYNYNPQNLAPQTYNPSHVQAQDQQPTQSHYLYHHHYNQAQQYPSYYPQNYTANAYQPNQQPEFQEPAPIHPPGVPIAPEQGFGQTHFQNLQNSYYPQPVVEPQQQQQLSYSDPTAHGQQWQGNSGGVGLIPLYSSKCLATRFELG